MRNYCFNRQELLRKAKKDYGNRGKEKDVKYYQANKDDIKGKEKNNCKNLSEHEKEAKTQYSKNWYQQMKD